MLRPPKTNDPALNRFLEEVANTIQDRVRPEEGWTLSDFASSVSEVISDKRDLIDIVTKYDNIEGLSEEMEAAVALLKMDVQDSMALLSSVNSKSAEFAEVMEWWDQNYAIIFSASEAMEIFEEISASLEGHQDILNQIEAATEAVGNAVAEARAAEASAKAAETAAKISETNAADAAVRAETSETAAGERAVAAASSATAAQASETAASDSATAAKASEEEAEGSAIAATERATAAAADAGRAESAAAGVDQVVSDAAGVLSVEIADDLAASQAARAGAESARDEAGESATLASTKADEAAASAATADGRATDAENSVASIAAHATDAEDAASRAAVSETNATASATLADSRATAAQGHADRAATEAGAAAHIAAAEKIAELVGSAPSDLDTFYELAAALADRGDAIAAIQTALANRIVGDYTVVVQPTPPQGGTTPSNQITFVTGAA